MKTTIGLSELVEDFDLYPRNGVDDTHISDLVRALKGGATLPLPVVDQKTKVIVDGFHRTRAWRRVLGADGEVEVEMREFPSKREMFLAAVELNSGHGRKLDRHDQIRIVNKASEMRISKANIAIALHLEPAIVENLKVRVTTVEETGEVVPKKSGMGWVGESITSEQYAGAKSVRTPEPVRCANELITMMECGLVNWDDEKVVCRLRDLRDRLDESLVA